MTSYLYGISMEQMSHSEEGQLLKERIWACENKVFPFKFDAYGEGRQKWNRRVASPESVLIHLN